MPSLQSSEVEFRAKGNLAKKFANKRRLKVPDGRTGNVKERWRNTRHVAGTTYSPADADRK
jgi:hypothetical protein